MPHYLTEKETLWSWPDYLTVICPNNTPNIFWVEIDFYERIKLTRLNDVACQIIRLLNGFFTPPADESWRVGGWRALKMMVLVTFFHIFSKRYIIATLAYCARGRCTGPSIIRTVLEIAAKPEMDHWFPALISRKHKVTWMLESPPLSLPHEMTTVYLFFWFNF